MNRNVNATETIDVRKLPAHTIEETILGVIMDVKRLGGHRTVDLNGQAFKGTVQFKLAGLVANTDVPTRGAGLDIARQAVHLGNVYDTNGIIATKTEVGTVAIHLIKLV